MEHLAGRRPDRGWRRRGDGDRRVLSDFREFFSLLGPVLGAITISCLCLAGLVLYAGRAAIGARRRRERLDVEAVRLQDRGVVRSTSQLDGGFSFRWQGRHGQVVWTGDVYRLTVAMGPMPRLSLADVGGELVVSGAHAALGHAYVPEGMRSQLASTQHVLRVVTGQDCTADFDELVDADIAAVLQVLQVVQVRDPWGDATEALALHGSDPSVQEGTRRGQPLRLEARPEGLQVTFPCRLRDLYLCHIEHAFGPSSPIDPVTDLLVVGRGRAAALVEAHREPVLALIHGHPGSRMDGDGLVLVLPDVRVGQALIASVDAALDVLDAAR